MTADTRKIGILVGREWSFPPAFIEEVARRRAGVAAEFIRLGGSFMNEEVPYAVIIDRMSHEIPYYRSYLKNAVLQGTRVINDPFRWAADDKYFAASLAARLGVAHPRTVALPNKSVAAEVSPESFRNLIYPLDWQSLIDYVGLPAVIKSAHGGGWKEAYRVASLQELIWRYDESESLTMVVQEYVPCEANVRCLVIGREHVLPLRFEPRERRYRNLPAAGLDRAVHERCSLDALRLCRALGYDMNAVDFAIHGGVPYAIDVLDPVPDLDVYALTPGPFEWAVKRLADVAIAMAQEDRAPEGTWLHEDEQRTHPAAPGRGM